MQSKPNLGKPIIWPPSPTAEDEARQKADEEAWATLEMENREAKQACAKAIEEAVKTFNIAIEAATRQKKKTIDEAYVYRQAKYDHSMQKFRAATLPPPPETPSSQRMPVIVGIADPTDESHPKPAEA